MWHCAAHAVGFHGVTLPSPLALPSMLMPASAAPASSMGPPPASAEPPELASGVPVEPPSAPPPPPGAPPVAQVRKHESSALHCPELVDPPDEWLH